MVSFTGSTRAGKRVAQLGAETVKRVALELGGKSANVLLDDLDEAGFAKAVADGVGKSFLNSGQTCSALTRMLVPRERMEQAEQIAAAAAEKVKVGSPFAEGVHLGPLASAAQRDRVQGYIQKGIDEGATVVAGGLGAPDGLDTGFYVKPTVFSNVSPEMTIAQEEIFGPVLSILPYDTEEDAVRSPTASSTASPAACGRATPTTPRRWPASCAPARWRSTAGRSTRTRRSVATSSPATAASTAATASRSSSRSSPSSSELVRRARSPTRWPGPRPRSAAGGEQAGDVVRLAEVLQAVLDDADDAHRHRDRRVPAVSMTRRGAPP